VSKIDKILQLGCIVCRNDLGTFTPAQFHHIHGPDKRRIGPDVGIGLCFPHHQSGINNTDLVSRHPWKREFEKRYGKEIDLYEQVLKTIGEKNEANYKD